MATDEHIVNVSQVTEKNEFLVYVYRSFVAALLAVTCFFLLKVYDRLSDMEDKQQVMEINFAVMKKTIEDNQIIMRQMMEKLLETERGSK